MRTPSWLVIVPLFVVVWVMSMLAAGWPRAVVYATDGQPPSGAGHVAVVAQGDNDGEDSNDSGGNSSNSNNNNSNTNSNNNEANSDGDNNSNNNEANSDGDNNSNSNEANSNNNDNHETVNIVPVPVAVPVSAPAPAAPSASAVDEVAQCLSNGGTLVYQGPDAAIAVKSFQDNLNVTLTRVSPSSQPMPPGLLIGNYEFRLSASPCGGAAYSVLPSEVNLAVGYSDALASGRDESRFALMRYDGSTWTTAPKLYRDPDTNHVSVSVTGLGVYALVQQ